MSERSPAVLFVCLGNICRSPLAEAAFRSETARAGLTVEIDSAGTGDWHAGSPPDPRAQAVALAAGADIAALRARQVTVDDFSRFTHIFAMDAQNLADLRAIAPADTSARVSLLLDLVPGREGASVSDPYYGGEELFEYTWDDVTAAARALVAELAR
ncbi:low molecular weight protein-tyrosine-phosphatase [Pelagerythrobacter sp.]|uniref:low molecular weight protein-tyrosine-phosphatase n=1 Tax=Pelagerythrobacter sp. TaxID=2800702 RepID=UPI0035B2B54E